MKKKSFLNNYKKDRQKYIDSIKTKINIKLSENHFLKTSIEDYKKINQDFKLVSSDYMYITNEDNYIINDLVNKKYITV